MALKDLTEQQLETRLVILEAKIANTYDVKDLEFYNKLYSQVMDELVARDMEKLVGEHLQKEGG